MKTENDREWDEGKNHDGLSDRAIFISQPYASLLLCDRSKEVSVVTVGPACLRSLTLCDPSALKDCWAMREEKTGRAATTMSRLSP